MYILIEFDSYLYGNNTTYAFENFNVLKERVVERLNGCGWDEKHKVDMRSIDSCVRYLCDDFKNVRWKKSTSYDKYFEYRNGNKRRVI